MARTLELLTNVLLPDLANLTYSYFAHGSCDSFALAKNGEWEEASSAIADNCSGVLEGACAGGHIELVRFAIPMTQLNTYRARSPESTIHLIGYRLLLFATLPI
jgi:hypothetical protein